MRKLLSPGRLAIAGLVLLAFVAALLVLLPGGGPYIFLPDEPHAAEPLVTIEGEPRPEDDPGGIFFVDVIVRRATLLERLWPGVREGASVVPEHAVNPAGVSDTVRRQSSLRVMGRSQRIAAAVALREAGHDVDARQTGALVSQVLPDAPAAGFLLPSDVIVAVEGREIRTPVALQRALAPREPGDRVSLTIRRGADREEIAVELGESPREEGRAILGILVEQAVDVQLPLDVEIDAANVGGPSAGLAFALAVLEFLGRDVDGGLRVAVTGELSLDGTVGSVGGIEQKTIGARQSDIDVFVVPAGENAEEARRHADGLRIVPVRSFQQALQALATASEAAEN